jgi:hypothetical protein
MNENSSDDEGWALEPELLRQINQKFRCKDDLYDYMDRIQVSAALSE